MNLCVNARDAMPHGGKLTIEAQNTSVDETYARMQMDARPGRFVLISVTDTGIGIPDHIITRIFEPFFTTKDQSKGTGLGLSTVLGIVKGHSGFINVYSEVGKGTQFRIYLPAAEGFETTQSQSPQEIPSGHGEVVLVVDDEASIREITKGTLETYGYKVLTAGDGTEALAIYAEHRDAVALVLTDMMMPYMDGPSTIRALQKMNPNIKIIAATGLSANAKTSDGSALNVQKFLSKPYSAESLLIAIAEVLKVGR
jgi:CheY-like chemotaxis protein